MPEQQPAPLPVRLVVLAPHPGSNGPAYYVDQLLEHARPHVAEVVALRHGAAGEDSWADVRGFRRRVGEVLAQASPYRTVLHAELSGGAIAAFWGLADHPGVRRTATVHDPPRPVSFPFRTAFLSRHRVLQGLVHRVPQRAHLALERKLMSGVDAVALSPAGVAALRGLGMFGQVLEGQLLVPDAPPIPPPGARPSAVGVFGHVYKGKGFEQLPAIRAALPADITLRVAGRGTEQLPPVPGVEFLGGLADEDVAGFFASIRLLLLPYQPTRMGPTEPVPASLTHLTALAHDTPVLATPTRQTIELSMAGGLHVEIDAPRLGVAAGHVLDDDRSLEGLLRAARAYRATRTVEAALAPYLELWGRP